MVVEGTKTKLFIAKSLTKTLEISKSKSNEMATNTAVMVLIPDFLETQLAHSQNDENQQLVLQKRSLLNY